VYDVMGGGLYLGVDMHDEYEGGVDLGVKRMCIM